MSDLLPTSSASWSRRPTGSRTPSVPRVSGIPDSYSLRRGRGGRTRGAPRHLALELVARVP